jgi:hypothetical protein
MLLGDELESVGGADVVSGGGVGVGAVSGVGVDAGANGTTVGNVTAGFSVVVASLAGLDSGVDAGVEEVAEVVFEVELEVSTGVVLPTSTGGTKMLPSEEPL